MSRSYGVHQPINSDNYERVISLDILKLDLIIKSFPSKLTNITYHEFVSLLKISNEHCVSLSTAQGKKTSSCVEPKKWSKARKSKEGQTALKSIKMTIVCELIYREEKLPYFKNISKLILSWLSTRPQM